MTSTIARLLAAVALMLTLGFLATGPSIVSAQDDTATEVTEEGEDAIDTAQEEGEDAVDTIQEEGGDAIDTAQEEASDAADSVQEEAAQVVDDDDGGFDDWGLLGLLGLLGLGGLFRRPGGNDDVVVTRTTPRPDTIHGTHVPRS